MDVLRSLCLGMTFLGGLPVADSLDAAPFVLGAPRPWAARIADSRAAIIATPAADGDQSGWKIEKCLRDLTGAVTAGNIIHPLPAPSVKHPAVLLLARRDGVLEPVPLSAAAISYLQTLPGAGEPLEKRLAHAFQYLDADDRSVAEDAFAVLANCSGPELRRHKSLLPAEKLRSLVKAETTPSAETGFYAYLLGLAGNSGDAAVIRRRLQQTDNGLAQGVAGLVGGYLLLTGDKGLAELEAKFLVNKNRSPIFVAAFFESLQTLSREHPQLFSQERLRQTASYGLQRTDAADLAIGFLAGQRTWKALPEVAKLLRSGDPEPVRRRAVQVTVVRYLIACRRDASASEQARIKAARLLGQIAQTDADLLRRAERIAGTPPRN